MKLQINSTHKIIKLEEQVNLGELFTFLEEILPDLKWREYSLQQPVSWVYYPYHTYTLPPTFPPYDITCENNG